MKLGNPVRYFNTDNITPSVVDEGKVWLTQRFNELSDHLLIEWMLFSLPDYTPSEGVQVPVTGNFAGDTYVFHFNDVAEALKNEMTRRLDRPIITNKMIVVEMSEAELPYDPTLAMQRFLQAFSKHASEALTGKAAEPHYIYKEDQISGNWIKWYCAKWAVSAEAAWMEGARRLARDLRKNLEEEDFYMGFNNQVIFFPRIGTRPVAL